MKDYELRIPDFRSIIFEAVFLGFFVFFVLLIFQPFGTYNFEHDNKVILLSGYGIIGLSVHFVFRGVLRKFWVGNWDLFKESIFFVVALILTGFFSFLYHQLVISNSFDIAHFPFFFIMFLSVGILPVAVMFWTRLNMGKQVKEQNKSENYTITLTGDYQGDVYKFDQRKILFVKSEGNYVKVVYEAHDKSDFVMIRARLKNMVSQLPHFFIRSHRSYLVNLRHRPDFIIKEGSNYLVLGKHKEYVPVSKMYRPDVKSSLQDLT